jgi:hypothetical protein
MEKYIRNWSWSNLLLAYYLGICIERPRKTTKTLSQDSRSPGRDLNQGPPKYETRVRTHLIRTFSMPNVRMWEQKSSTCPQSGVWSILHTSVLLSMASMPLHTHTPEDFTTNNCKRSINIVEPRYDAPSYTADSDIPRLWSCPPIRLHTSYVVQISMKRFCYIIRLYCNRGQGPYSNMNRYMFLVSLNLGLFVQTAKFNEHLIWFRQEG